MRHWLEPFADYLTLERGLSENTRMAYGRDVGGFLDFALAAGRKAVRDIARDDIADYLMACKERGLAPTSMARCLVAIRVFFRYLQEEGMLRRQRRRRAGVAEALAGPARHAVAGGNRPPAGRT